MNERFCPDNTKVAIIGGGNIGTQFACMIASKGYSVNLHTSKPELFSDTIEIVDENGLLLISKLNFVSSNVRDVLEDCNVVFVTHPAFRLETIANKILPYIHKDTYICVLPGTGGAEFAFKRCIEAGATLCGLQRVPSVARLEEYGKRVRCEGVRSELFLGSIPQKNASVFAEFLSDIWNIPCRVLPNYLSVTLTPSNPILHTTRLRTLFSDYREGVVYNRNPFFYGEWNDESSERLIKADEELQNICRLFKNIDLSNVRSLKFHYESESVKSMTEKLRSIRSLNRLPSPMKEVEGGWVPDFDSRYFTADFPYGLAIIEELAELLGYNTPTIKDTMNWYVEVTGNKRCFSFDEYGSYHIKRLLP